MNCIVFKLSENLRKKLIDFYKEYKVENNPPYSVMQAKMFDCTITLYESGKVMFQGIGAENEAEVWKSLEKKVNNINIETPSKEKEKKKDEGILLLEDSIGSDETGCGDVFGPIVVCASYVKKEQIGYLKELGVKDSKKIDDEYIKEITPKIIEMIPYHCIIVDNLSYNTTFKNMNMVQIKSIIHNKALCELIKKCSPNYKYAVIDEFVNSRKYYEYVSNSKEILRNITFYPRAESKCYSVAVASIIARYIYLMKMDELSKKIGFPLQKGAGFLVDDQIKKMMQEKIDLSQYAKLNFKNITKMQDQNK